MFLVVMAMVMILMMTMMMKIKVTDDGRMTMLMMYHLSSESMPVAVKLIK